MLIRKTAHPCALEPNLAKADVTININKREDTMSALKAVVIILALSGLSFGLPLTQKPVKSSLQGESWPGWGGPMRDFNSDAKGLANVWPSDGPKRMWSRPLGEGHSSIIGEGGRLYTMYRPSTGVRNSWKAEEVVVALEAATGKTLWEYRYPTSLETMNFSRGAGPHSTPLLVGNRLFAA